MNVDTARAQARLNNVNQITPYGNISYEEIAPDRWQATTQLGQAEQVLKNYQDYGRGLYGQMAVDQLGKVQETLSKPGDYSPWTNESNAGLAQARRAGDAAEFFSQQPLETDYNKVRDNAVTAAMSRITPQAKEDEENLRSRLLNSGIGEGSEAWNNAYRQFNNAQNDMRMQAVLNAEDLAGKSIAQTGTLRQIPMNEMAQLSNMATNRFNLGNAAVQQQMQLRNAPLNEASALLTGNMIQTPQAAQVAQTQIAPTDYMGAVGQQQAAQQSAYQQQMAAHNANLSGLYGLGSTVIMGAVM